MTEEQEKQLAILLQRYAAIVEVTLKSDDRRKKARLAIFNFVNGLPK